MLQPTQTYSSSSIRFHGGKQRAGVEPEVLSPRVSHGRWRVRGSSEGLGSGGAPRYHRWLMKLVALCALAAVACGGEIVPPFAGAGDDASADATATLDGTAEDAGKIDAVPEGDAQADAAPVNAPYCPTAYQPDASPCPTTESVAWTCTYPEGVCDCGGGCADPGLPPQGGPGSWECWPTREDGCPPHPPMGESACDDDGRTCRYAWQNLACIRVGPDGGDCYAMATCATMGWKWTLTPGCTT